MTEGQPVHHQEEPRVGEQQRNIVKITANLPVPVFNALKELADSRGTSMTEQIRQVVSTEYFLEQEISSGATLVLESPEGAERKVNFSHISDKRSRLDRLKSRISGIAYHFSP